MCALESAVIEAGDAEAEPGADRGGADRLLVGDPRLLLRRWRWRRRRRRRRLGRGGLRRIELQLDRLAGLDVHLLLGVEVTLRARDELVLALEEAQRLLERQGPRREHVDGQHHVRDLGRDVDDAEVGERLLHLLFDVLAVVGAERANFVVERRLHRVDGLLPVLEREVGVADHPEDLRARVDGARLLEERERLVVVAGLVRGEAVGRGLAREVDLGLALGAGDRGHGAERDRDREGEGRRAGSHQNLILPTLGALVAAGFAVFGAAGG